MTRRHDRHARRRRDAAARSARGARLRPLGGPRRGLAARPHDPRLRLPVPADRRRRPVRVQRHRTGASPPGTASRFKWFEVALNDSVVQKALAQQLHRRASRTPSWRPSFGTMAALGLQRVGKKSRLVFDALTYTSIIVPEIVIALATLVLFATGFDVIESIVRGQAQLRAPDDHRGARAVQHQPRAAARPGAAVGDGPDARRGQLRPVRDAVADVPPDHLPDAPAGDRRRVPAVVHVQLRRLRHHDVRVRARARRRCRCSSSARSSAA